MAKTILGKLSKVLWSVLGETATPDTVPCHKGTADRQCDSKRPAERKAAEASVNGKWKYEKDVLGGQG